MRNTMVWAAMLAMAMTALLLALAVGRFALSPLHVLDALRFQGDADAQAVLWHARMPRALASWLVGAALGMSGAALQGVFRNPLAGPQTVGVLSGAGLGGALAISVGHGSLGVMGLAFSGGLVAVALVVVISRAVGGPAVLMIVLSGVLVGSFAAALTALLQALADPETQLPRLVYWLMGSFATVRSDQIIGLMIAVIPAGILLWGYGLRLDILASGDDEAKIMGVNVVRDRAIVLALVALLGAASVATAGVIGWVGLVVPHAARFLIGPNHNALLPASALLGGTLLCLMDTAARTITSAELPISALTAVIGGPVFFLLLMRLKKTASHG